MGPISQIQGCTDRQESTIEIEVEIVRGHGHPVCSVWLFVLDHEELLGTKVEINPKKDATKYIGEMVDRPDRGLCRLDSESHWHYSEGNG